MAQSTANPEIPTNPNDNPSNSGTSVKRKHAAGGAEGGERKRVSQACDQCRSKKLKCDGGKPSCTSCLSQNRRCIYGSTVKKRGLPEGYVRGLEKLLGMLASREQLEMRTVSVMFADALENQGTKADLMDVWNGGEEGNTLPEIWRNSALSKNLEHLLPELESADGRPVDVKRPRLEPHLMDRSREYNTDVKRADGLPLQEEAEALLEFYFIYTHCWLPIVVRDEIYAVYYRTLELSQPSMDSGDDAVLWAILAYAEAQKSNVKTQTPGSIQNQSAIGRAWYEKARGLIPPEGEDFKIGHVQAFLVLSLVNLSLGQLSTAWLLVGQAVNIAIDIGLGKGSAFDVREPLGDNSGRRKNVFLGCFCLDTLIAARLERCPRLIKEDAQMVGPLEENGIAEWGHWKAGDSRYAKTGPSRSISTFNQFVRLNYVLNDSIRETYLGVAGDEAFDHAHHRLHIWKKQLPAHCLLRPVSDKDTNTLLPHQLNMNLMFVISMTTLALRCDGPKENFNNTMAKYPDHLLVPTHVLQQLHNFSSTFGPSAFPGTLHVLLGLLQELGRRTPGKQQDTDWNASLLRLVAETNAIFTTASRLSPIPMHTPSQVEYRKPSIQLEHTSPPSVSPQALPGLPDAAPWTDQSTYLAAGDLFHFAQASRKNAEFRPAS
ncbi:quinic acid utilization activator [Phlyctema vagabunda]|uniref:Quinic acid utilization activator n=1 Tax=Phlyctema vagabunda TaxID=108571 RepID=A0ABR4PG25_9HELO